MPNFGAKRLLERSYTKLERLDGVILNTSINVQCVLIGLPLLEETTKLPPPHQCAHLKFACIQR
jgi:hypothetical protein